ncbi:ABC transporter ATP-binding protein [Paenibacillus mucilaginosus]|uniref:OppD n=3 Tax=Paenibacillus mucilaginosus TaxID=61624 RepID=H6NG92_9BACL|nr:ABC transporter ATP-binding protein [Paenibacillus mucilaginosus]AEI42613.1 OppD [Paenibacillus mucilaginosus KNP414]AFC32219.1 OppD [Paenibacillus mucilaginosus 3016]AFH64521.1 peptide ABC transporter ATP-binding protein [Paenibacillus mucilaginosus K02]MCG7214003.1 ABC transporter ATP-binding protein [Paenibacillus mucilaginosus]WDM26003.1 ABC transporter ATP-binding protein [Paenibacillus mucilaginosus]
MSKAKVHPLLEVKDLRVSFNTYAGEVQAVRGVSFHLNKGEVLAIVGESGCGKSVTAQTIMRLIPSPPSVIKGGSILFDGKTEITKISDKQMEKIRGSEMGMIFQDPMTSLNPTMTIGKQITEGLIKHQGMSQKAADARAVEILKLVGISNPEGRIRQYPHEFSGGMRQRVMIAIALACNPKLLIADEPTTALDVTIQAQIIDLMKKLSEETEASIIVITHDLGVVAEMAQRVVVMYAGQVAEQGTVDEIFYNPKHPYTWGLLRSVPRLDQPKDSDLVPIPGTPPDLFAPPKGCPFAARCPYAMNICVQENPAQTQLTETHSAACWLLHPDAPKVERPVEAGGGTR